MATHRKSPAESPDDFFSGRLPEILLRRGSCLFPVLIGIFLLLFPVDIVAQEEEETYSITFTKTAENKTTSGEKREILEVEGRRVLTETHAVQKGEWLWKILNKKELTKKKNFVELMEILKKLNPELTNLDKIHPGQKIIIPLTLAPAGSAPTPAVAAAPVPVTPSSLEKLELEDYTVEMGDSLIKIINRKYASPDMAFCEEYLQAVKKLNPNIENLNLIYPGQKIRLPLYSPEVLRMPIEDKPPPPAPAAVEMPELDMEPPPESVIQISSVEEIRHPLRDRLGRLFKILGEDWIQRGQHYIPLKGQGEINLRADAYPMIDLSNGLKVIVDLQKAMPGRMAGLIESSWDNYRIVHLDEGDDLRSALGRILPECGLGTILKPGEPLHLGDEIPLRLSADWIIRKTGAMGGPEDAVMITLLDEGTPPTPEPIKSYLAKRGVQVVDFPPGAAASPLPRPSPRTVTLAGTTPRDLLEGLLDLMGLDYLRNVEIPVYGKKDSADYNLFVKADYLLEIDGHKFMLDLTGVGSDLINLMRERDMSYLHLREEGEPLTLVRRILEFLNLQFTGSPLDFMASERDELRNIRVSIQGVAFFDKSGRHLLATQLLLPEEITQLAAGKGYQILKISYFQ